jgi:hypothetical protein
MSYVSIGAGPMQSDASAALKEQLEKEGKLRFLPPLASVAPTKSLAVT